MLYIDEINVPNIAVNSIFQSQIRNINKLIIFCYGLPLVKYAIER